MHQPNFDWINLLLLLLKQKIQQKRKWLDQINLWYFFSSSDIVHQKLFCFSCLHRVSTEYSIILCKWSFHQQLLIVPSIWSQICDMCLSIINLLVSSYFTLLIWDLYFCDLSFKSMKYSFKSMKYSPIFLWFNSNQWNIILYFTVIFHRFQILRSF